MLHYQVLKAFAAVGASPGGCAAREGCCENALEGGSLLYLLVPLGYPDKLVLLLPKKVIVDMGWGWESCLP